MAEYKDRHTYKFLEINVDCARRARETFPKARSGTEENINVELTVLSSDLNCKMRRPNSQSSTSLNF